MVNTVRMVYGMVSINSGWSVRMRNVMYVYECGCHRLRGMEC